MDDLKITLSHFPKLREDQWVPITAKNTVGKAQGDLFYRKDADFVFTCMDHWSIIQRTLKHVPADRLIGDFFTWDYALEKLRNPDTWGNLLTRLKENGISKISGMDFSIFYDQPDIISLYNLYHNLLKSRQAQDRGFDLVLNWNWIQARYEPVYQKCLPSGIPCLMMDLNHYQTKETQRYNVDAFEMLTRITDIGHIVIQHGKTSLVPFAPLVASVKQHNISYVTIPSQSVLLSKIAQSQRHARVRKASDDSPPE
jgi:hypothetical protein